MQSEQQVAEDIDLIQKIGTGDRASFEEFYRRYAALIYSTAFRVLNQQTEAEDVMQDVMFMIWEKSPMFDSARGKPLTWAITMTRNKAIDRLRSIQRRIRLHDEVENEVSHSPHCYDQAPTNSLEATEQSRMVRSAVMKLNKEQREVIELSFFGGMTQQEIATRIKSPIGTVKARIRRGMLRLKKLVSPTF